MGNSSASSLTYPIIRLNALQLLVDIATHISQFLGQRENWLDRKKWPCRQYNSPSLQQQVDGWSCGLFVFMAMKAVVYDTGFETVCNDAKEVIKRVALQMILEIPYVF